MNPQLGKWRSGAPCAEQASERELHGLVAQQWAFQGASWWNIDSTRSGRAGTPLAHVLMHPKPMSTKEPLP